MPVLDVSELNIVVSVLGAFTLLYGLISVKIKQVWFLGEALPAMMIGIILGPIAARFLNTERWGSAAPDQTGVITLGVARIVIGVQLVIAGFQLPAKYTWARWRDMALLLLPVMTIMWLCTTGCILLCIPGLTTLSALVIGSMVTCTDPVLSQAIAKGPFADKYVPRALREIISAEAGANDGFGFPFLLLATYLIRHAPRDELNYIENGARLAVRAEEVGRLGGGDGAAMYNWFVEGWLYFIITGAVVGAFLGIVSMYAITFTLKRKWIDTECLLLFPTALGLFIIGVTGLAGLDDLLACFCAGCALNWNGVYLEETLTRHDEVSSSVDVLLNFGGFMYIGAVLPWDEFNNPEVTGITPGRLIGLGVMVLLFRRIPALLAIYKLLPHTVTSWKEALFAGYFGPIGIGAVFYVEHSLHLFPDAEDVETYEELNLVRAMRPTVYFLVIFSIVVHGLSIPALELIYRWRGVQPIVELEPSMERRKSMSTALPPNSHVDPIYGDVVRHNRFSVAISRDNIDELEDGWSVRSRTRSMSRPASRSVFDNTSIARAPSRRSRATSRATSRGRQMPDAPPIWRLTSDVDSPDDEGNEKEVLQNNETPQQEKPSTSGPRIQFLDEAAARKPRTESDVRGDPGSFVLRDGVHRTKSIG